MQSALIAGRIRALAGEKNLPVIAFIEDVGASGGYWLALAGDEIFAAPSSIVGSIGVVHASFGFAEVLDRLGIERRLYTAGSKKSLLDPFRPQDPEDVDRLMEIMTEIHGDFKAWSDSDAAIDCERRTTSCSKARSGPGARLRNWA